MFIGTKIQNKNNNNVSEENPFSLSLGDLMAAILLIFILLLSATLLMLQQQFEQKNKLAEETQKSAELAKLHADEIQKIAKMYDLLKVQLYQDMLTEFKDDLETWNAVLDKETLSIRFQEPDVLFQKGESEIKTDFKTILDNFFPRYIKIIFDDKYKSNIEEIRIEGHTSSEWINELDTDKSYFKNMELSQNRTRSVLEYVLRLVDGTQKEWCLERLTANGLSSSKLIHFDNGSEDPERSRRVEFRIRTNADEQIGKMLQRINGDA